MIILNRGNRTINITRSLPRLNLLAVPGVCIYSVGFNNQANTIFVTSTPPFLHIVCLKQHLQKVVASVYRVEMKEREQRLKTSSLSSRDKERSLSFSPSVSHNELLRGCRSTTIAHSVSTDWRRQVSAHQLKSYQLYMVENSRFALTHANQQC